MKLAINRLAKWIGAVSMVVLAPLAQANLVANGDFEGNFALWTTNPNTVALSTLANHTSGGSQSALFGVSSAPGDVPQTLGQSLSVDPLTTYAFGFWAKCVHTATSQTCSTTSFDVFFGDNPTATSYSFDVSESGFDHYVGTFTSGVSTNLAMNFTADVYSAEQNLWLDDVTVEKVPEPGTLLLVGAALTAGAIIRRRRVV